MKKILILSVLTALAMSVAAQTSSDAFRYSHIMFNGSARFMGTAGAFGAVGADFSVMATNPAGIGMYRSSEFSFSPTLHIGYTKSDYNGVNTSEYKVNPGMSTLGLVFTIPMNKQKSGGLRNINFGFGMNRQNDFNNRIYIEGPNNKNSILTDWVNTINKNPNQSGSDIEYNYPFDIGLAYDASLIYYDTIHHNYTCDGPKGPVYQRKSIRTAGSINEFDFSMGGNFSDWLYFGLTIGVPTIRYYETTLYQENDLNGTIPYFSNMDYNFNLETHGTGINLKAGLLFRPLKWLRLGVAVHTPTWYGNMRDYWYSSLSAYYDSTLTNNTQYSPDGSYHYQMATPFRTIGSIAFVIGKLGLISADYEYVDYGQARLYTTDNTSFSDVNQEIVDKYKWTGNLRVGTEWVIWNFRVRAGFGYFGNPYHSGYDKSEGYLATGGFGYRGKHLFADMAYTWNQNKSDYYLYSSTLVNPAHNTYISHSVIATFGVRF